MWAHVIPCEIMWHHVRSCDTMWNHVTWDHVIPCETMWYHVSSCDTMWAHVIPCKIMWYHVSSCDIMWNHVIPCELMWYHVNSWYHVSSYDIMWNHVIPCELMDTMWTRDTMWNHVYHVKSCIPCELMIPCELVIPCELMWYHVTSCEIMWHHVRCDTLWLHVILCELMRPACEIMWFACDSVTSCDTLILPSSNYICRSLRCGARQLSYKESSTRTATRVSRHFEKFCHPLSHPWIPEVAWLSLETTLPAQWSESRHVDNSVFWGHQILWTLIRQWSLEHTNNRCCYWPSQHQIPLSKDI